MCGSFVASNWCTPLLADTFASLALPFGVGISLVALSFAFLLLYLMPHTERRIERLRSTVLMLSIVVIAISFNIAYGRGLPPGSFASGFDSDLWKDKDSSGFTKGDLTTRQKMLGSVVYQILPNKSRLAVEDLLGDASRSGYFTQLDPDLLYCLGPERSFIGIDSEWLAIWFNEDSLVVRWELLND